MNHTAYWAFSKLEGLFGPTLDSRKKIPWIIHSIQSIINAWWQCYSSNIPLPLLSPPPPPFYCWSRPGAWSTPLSHHKKQPNTRKTSKNLITSYSIYAYSSMLLQVVYIFSPFLVLVVSGRGRAHGWRKGLQIENKKITIRKKLRHSDTIRSWVKQVRPPRSFRKVIWKGP